jgi:hypothetical protein
MVENIKKYIAVSLKKRKSYLFVNKNKINKKTASPENSR